MKHKFDWFLILAMAAAMGGLALLPSSTTGYVIAETILGPVGLVSFVMVCAIVGIALGVNALRLGTRKKGPGLENTVGRTQTQESIATDFLDFPSTAPADAPQDVRAILSEAEHAAIAGDQKRTEALTIAAAEASILQNYALPRTEIDDLRTQAARSCVRRLLLDAYATATVPAEETKEVYEQTSHEAQRIIDAARTLADSAGLSINGMQAYDEARKAIDDLRIRTPIESDLRPKYRATVKLFKKAAAEAHAGDDSLTGKLQRFTRVKQRLATAVAAAQKEEIPERVYTLWQQPVELIVKDLANTTMLAQAERIRDFAMRGEWDEHEAATLRSICETTGHPGAQEYIAKMAMVAHARIMETTDLRTIAEILVKKKELLKADKEREISFERYERRLARHGWSGDEEVKESITNCIMSSIYYLARHVCDTAYEIERDQKEGQRLLSLVWKAKLNPEMTTLVRRFLITFETHMLERGIGAFPRLLASDTHLTSSYLGEIQHWNRITDQYERLETADPLIRAGLKSKAIAAYTALESACASNPTIQQVYNSNHQMKSTVAAELYSLRESLKRMYGSSSLPEPRPGQQNAA